MKFLAWLKELCSISQLPGWGSTVAVWGIILSAAAGWAPAAKLWHDDSGAITTLYLGGLGIWLGTKAATRISDAVATKGESAGKPPEETP